VEDAVGGSFAVFAIAFGTPPADEARRGGNLGGGDGKIEIIDEDRGGGRRSQSIAAGIGTGVTATDESKARLPPAAGVTVSTAEPWLVGIVIG